MPSDRINTRREPKSILSLSSINSQSLVTKAFDKHETKNFLLSEEFKKGDIIDEEFKEELRKEADNCIKCTPNRNEVLSCVTNHIQNLNKKQKDKKVKEKENQRLEELEKLIESGHQSALIVEKRIIESANESANKRELENNSHEVQREAIKKDIECNIKKISEYQTLTTLVIEEENTKSFIAREILKKQHKEQQEVEKQAIELTFQKITEYQVQSSLNITQHQAHSMNNRVQINKEFHKNRETEQQSFNSDLNELDISLRKLDSQVIWLKRVINQQKLENSIAQANIYTHSYQSKGIDSTNNVNDKENVCISGNIDEEEVYLN